MEIQEFIEKIAEQYEDANADTLTPDTEFRQVDNYSSLTALMILSIIDEEYNVTLNGDDMRKVKTIQELFDLVNSRI
ncbi:MAG: phosphopantetheine-binding protein [Bacteroidales bacterium]|nr:phosphopantetheine-binding protein [Bacteroidales bacterium]